MHVYIIFVSHQYQLMFAHFHVKFDKNSFYADADKICITLLTKYASPCLCESRGNHLVSLAQRHSENKFNAFLF